MSMMMKYVKVEKKVNNNVTKKSNQLDQVESASNGFANKKNELDTKFSNKIENKTKETAKKQNEVAKKQNELIENQSEKNSNGIDKKSIKSERNSTGSDKKSIKSDRSSAEVDKKIRKQERKSAFELEKKAKKHEKKFGLNKRSKSLEKVPVKQEKKSIELNKSVNYIFSDQFQELKTKDPDFNLLQSKLVDKLDAALFEHKFDDFGNTFLILFCSSLESRNKQTPKKKEIKDNITKLTNYLIDYYLVLNESNSQSKQMTCISNLINFYKNYVYKKELYIKYIYKLYDLHGQVQNWTEIGFTLLAYADLFSWSFVPIKEFIVKNDKKFLNQSTSGMLEWQRKEQLYYQIIENFEKDKYFEEGIRLFKEMELFFEKHNEYSKLSNLYRRKSEFYNGITRFRYEPTYFRVSFLGIGFPRFLSNRTFIYKGNSFEKIHDFIRRITNEFPLCEIITSGNPISEISKNDKIQILAVKPILEQNEELINKVDTFVYDRPHPKNDNLIKNKDNEFTSLWCERTILKIEKPLPGILRWFEVVNSNVTLLNPVQAACEAINNSIKELKIIIESYENEPDKKLTDLTMRLQGTIDASVNGGVRKYQEAFFDKAYIKNHNEYISDIKNLKKLIFDQINLLEKGLSVHKTLVHNSLIPLHELLVEKFSMMKKSFTDDSSTIYAEGVPTDKKPSVFNRLFRSIRYKSSKQQSTTPSTTVLFKAAA